MPRPPRIDIADGLHHVMSRGNGRAAIFHDDTDRRIWMKIFGRVLDEVGWACLGYCLMPNHFHLLVRTPRPTLSRGMHMLNGTYARRFIDRHHRPGYGHAFHDRFRSKLVTSETYLQELLRYLPLNPVRAGFCTQPEQWAWSSYRATIGVASGGRIELGWLDDLFSGDIEEYRRFVHSGIGQEAPFEFDLFATAAKVPPARRPLAEVIDPANLNATMLLANEHHGYPLREIAAHVGLHVSNVCRRVRAQRDGARDATQRA